MSFLDSSTTPNQTESSIIVDNDSSQNEETNNTISSMVNEESNQPTTSISSNATTDNSQQSGSSHQIYRRQRRISNNPTERMVEYLENRRRQNSNDDKVTVKCDGVDLLFLGYADSYKKLSKRKQANVKFNIAKIFMEAEVHDLEAESNTSSRTINSSNYIILQAPVTPETHIESNTSSHTAYSMPAPTTGSYSMICNDSEAAQLEDIYDQNANEPADLSASTNTSTYFSQFS